MTEQTSTNTVPTPAETTPESEGEQKAISPLKQTATLVAQYAKAMINDKRAQQFAAQVSLMARKDPQLARCHPDSLLASMMACVHLDLMPNTPEQLAYIIPYNNRKLGRVEAQFQLGYKGMCELAYRSQRILSVNAELVFKEDTFEAELGTERRLVHKPNYTIDRTDLTKATHIYATAKLANGENVFEVLSISELDKVRNSAKAQSTAGPWATWGESMAKKTAVKRLLKYLPQVAALQLGTEYDSWAEAGKLKVTQQGDLIEGEVAPPVLSDDDKKKIAEEAKAKAQALKAEANAGANAKTEVQQ